MSNIVDVLKRYEATIQTTRSRLEPIIGRKVFDLLLQRAYAITETQYPVIRVVYDSTQMTRPEHPDLDRDEVCIALDAHMNHFVHLIKTLTGDVLSKQLMSEIQEIAASA